MKQPSQFRKWFRILAVVTFSAWIVPLLFSLNFWQQEVGAALSRALRRPVSIGDVHLELVSGFGFRMSQVRVEEDRAFGAEPFARAESITARAAFLPLLRGRMEFVSLDVNAPSINIVRNAAGEWNLSRLGDSPTADSDSGLPEPEEAAAAPRVRVRNGRIHFKSGERKRAYRIESLDLDLSPPASPQEPWQFRLEAMPARTDIPFRPGNLVQASGAFGPIAAGLPKEAGIPLHVDWRAEDVMLAELLTVLTGEDFGVHGVFHLNGHASGTTSLFRVSAEGEIRDLHRWDLHAVASSRPLRASLLGVVDLSSEAVEMSSLSVPLGSGNAILRGRIDNLFRLPDPRIELELQAIPLAELTEFLPQFGTHIPRGLVAEGALSGRLWATGLSNGIFGTVEVGPGVFRNSASSRQLAYTAFPVSLQGFKGRLGPLNVNTAEGGPLRLAGLWDLAKGSSEWRLRGEEISIPVLLDFASEWGMGSNFVSIPQGKLGLNLTIATSAGVPPRIAGWAQVSDSVLEAYGVSQPLQISEARLQFQRDQLVIRPLAFDLGSAHTEGRVTARLTPALSPPLDESGALSIEFDLESDNIDIAEVTALLSPAAPEERFFRFGRPDIPFPTPLDVRAAAVLQGLAARGTLRSGAVRYGSVLLEDLSTAALWKNRRLELAGLSAAIAGGRGKGSAAFSFAPDASSFEMDVEYQGLKLEPLAAPSERWRGLVSGTIHGSFHLNGSGPTVPEVIAGLAGTGHLTGSEVVVRDPGLAELLGGLDGDEAGFSRLESQFAIEDRLIRITEFEAIPSDRSPAGERTSGHQTTLLVDGTIGFDQRLDLAVRHNPEGREAHWAGTLAEPRLVGNFERSPAVATRGKAGDASPSSE